MTLAEQIEQAVMVLVFKEKPDLSNPERYPQEYNEKLLFRGILAMKHEDGYEFVHVWRGTWPGSVAFYTFDFYHEQMNLAEWDDEILVWEMPWTKDPENPDMDLPVWIMPIRGQLFLEGE